MYLVKNVALIKRNAQVGSSAAMSLFNILGYLLAYAITNALHLYHHSLP